MGVEEGVVDVIIGSITTSGANDAHGHMEELPGERTPPHTHSLLESPQQRSINSAVWSLEGTYPANPVRELHFIPSLDPQQVVVQCCTVRVQCALRNLFGVLKRTVLL